jgi:uncharacterized protein (TIGR02099 family)
MILTLLKKTFALLLTASLILLLVLAVYVSLGRQLMPYVSNYHQDIEAQLSERLGQTLRFGVIEGRWSRFNPILTLRDVTISAPLSGAGAPPNFPTLQVNNLSLELNAWASLLQWRWLLSSITIESPEFTLEESADGRWQLYGFESDPNLALDPDKALNLVSRVQDLSMTNMRLHLRRANGYSRVFERSRLRIQNRNAQHFLHLDVWQDDVIGPLSVAAELSGDRVADLSGQLYVLLPNADYSELVAREIGDKASLSEFEGNAELWLSLQDGQMQSLQGNLDVARLGLHAPESYFLEDISSQFFLSRESESKTWELWLERFGFRWNAMQWRPSNLYLNYAEGGQTSLAADLFNLSISTGLLGDSSVLPEEGRLQLLEHNPRGELTNLDLEWMPSEENAGGGEIRLIANLNDVAMNARGPVPAIWGIDGYTELRYDLQQRKLTGFADVDSRRLMFQLPNLFNDVWVYDRVNGRVSIDLDVSQGQQLSLSSSVIVAESQVATGRAQFSLLTKNSKDEEPVADLELMVGITRGDVSQKAIYLPTSPAVKDGLRNLMTWLDEAILDGTALNSGLIFRGSVLPTSDPSTRTLQMVFDVENGTLRFDPQWPVLDSLNGKVLIDDRNVDIRVSSGQSLGIGFDSTTAAIRPSETGQGNWLTVGGRGAGEAQLALHYLQETPVTSGFGNYIADWQGQGEVGITLDLRIPLGIAGSSPQVDVGLQLQDDALYIPEFELNFAEVNGTMQYSSQTGLVGQDIQATLFDEAISVDLQSNVDDNRTTITRVEIGGAVDVPALRAWPKQSDFVVNMLGRATGKIDYMALLEIAQPASDGVGQQIDSATRRLTLDSTLQGIDLNYPAPFRKLADGVLPMHMTIDFLENREDLGVSLADIASLNIGLQDGQIRNGLVFLGKQSEGVSVRRLNANAPGLDVLGTLQHFDYSEWMDALGDTSSGTANPSSGGNFASLRNAINAVDVTIADAYAFGLNAQDINVQIASEPQFWKLSLASEVVGGEIQVPYASDMPLDVNLDYLHLPEPEEPAVPEPDFDMSFVGAPGPDDSYWTEAPRIDSLATLDPRFFPNMRFKAQAINRGESDYGSWQFLLKPNEGGAVFSDLLLDTRGVRAGKAGEEGRVVWTYDGKTHHSYFSSVLETGNLATVLSNYGYAPSLESSSAEFHVSVDWPGSPAFFSVESLSGDVDLRVLEGRFLQSNAGAANSALKLISIINFDALVRRLRFSDDLLRRGLSYEQIYGSLKINDGIVDIVDRLQIIGPASLFQVSGQLDLAQQTIDGNLFITLPLSDNIPWMSGIAMLNNLINWQVAVGVFLFDQIFGDQVDSLTSAQYTLKGPWEGLEPRLNQVFGTPGAPAGPPGTRATPTPGDPSTQGAASPGNLVEPPTATAN